MASFPSAIQSGIEPAPPIPIRLPLSVISLAATTLAARIPCSSTEIHYNCGYRNTIHHRDLLNHFTKHIAKNDPQAARRNAGNLQNLTADRGYGAKAFRDVLRKNGIRPLIKQDHRIMNLPEDALTASIDDDRYHQHSMFRDRLLLD